MYRELQVNIFFIHLIHSHQNKLRLIEPQSTPRISLIIIIITFFVFFCQPEFKFLA